MSEIVLRDVTKYFGSVHALDGISLEVAPGELVALLGPSGCGKTTLLRSVAGLLQPDSGQILIGGKDVTGMPTRERPIGMVSQSYALFPNMTLRNNIAFPLVVRNVPASEITRRVSELLDLVQLDAQADRYPKQVSAGQQQRTALVRALAPQPDVLLLDEPLSALDALVRHQLRDEIRRIQQAVRTTTIFVTHDQSEAMAIADRVAVMHRGRIEQIARPPELYDRPGTPFSAAFVGSRNGLELPVRDGQVSLGSAFAVRPPAGSGIRVVIFFRPEDVEIITDGRGHPATLEVKIFLGATTRLHLVTDVDGKQARIYADVPSRQAASLEPGSTLGIRVDPANVRVFSVEG